MEKIITIKYKSYALKAKIAIVLLLTLGITPIVLSSKGILLLIAVFLVCASYIYSLVNNYSVFVFIIDEIGIHYKNNTVNWEQIQSIKLQEKSISFFKSLSICHTQTKEDASQSEILDFKKMTDGISLFMTDDKDLITQISTLFSDKIELYNITLN